MKQVLEAVIQIRNSKIPNPNAIANAGSFFKNILLTFKEGYDFIKKFPQVAHLYDEKKKYIKIFTASLIEKAGFKDYYDPKVGVYDNQPLILINKNNASGQEIYDFSKKISKKIKNHFGLNITSEVDIIK